jgi:hypothetical protein
MIVFALLAMPGLVALASEPAFNPDVRWFGESDGEIAPTTSGACSFNINMLAIMPATEPIRLTPPSKAAISKAVQMAPMKSVPESIAKLKAFLDSRPNIQRLEEYAATLGQGFQWAQNSEYRFSAWKIDGGHFTIDYWGRVTIRAVLYDDAGDAVRTLTYKTWQEAMREERQLSEQQYLNELIEQARRQVREMVEN